MISLVVLDRDGVINYDSDDYIRSPDEWRPIPGSMEALSLLHQEGCALAVATNQSGIGRGYYNRATLEAIHNKMHQQVQAAGGRISTLRYCPHTPDADCDCRKPQPEMLVSILTETGAAANQTCFIGDSITDIEAARSAGVHPVLVLTGKGQATMMLHREKLADTPVYADLAAAALAIVHGTLLTTGTH